MNNIRSISDKVKLNNGVQMPMFGLGVYKSQSGEEVINAIHDALECGYRLIDTASYYKNEESVGEAVLQSDVDREDIFITTKVWNDDHGYQSTLDAFQRSMDKLKMDYVDLYLIHWPVPGKYLDTWKAMCEIQQSGKTKAIGLCNCMQHHIESVIESSGVVPAVIQNEFHPRLVQQSLLDYCFGQGIQYQAWSPLMRGRLLEDEVLTKLANTHNKTVAQIILRWDLQKGVATIPKSVHKERIVSNAAIFDFQLSSEEIAIIDALDRNERTGAHPDNFMEHFEQKG